MEFPPDLMASIQMNKCRSIVRTGLIFLRLGEFKRVHPEAGKIGRVSGLGLRHAIPFLHTCTRMTSFGRFTSRRIGMALTSTQSRHSRTPTPLRLKRCRGRERAAVSCARAAELPLHRPRIKRPDRDILHGIGTPRSGMLKYLSLPGGGRSIRGLPGHSSPTRGVYLEG